MYAEWNRAMSRITDHTCREVCLSYGIALRVLDLPRTDGDRRNIYGMSFLAMRTHTER